MSLERVFEASWTLRKLRGAPMGALLDGFCDGLLKQGFGQHSIRRHLAHVSHLNDWLAQRGWRWPGSLSRREIDGFFEAYPSYCRNRGRREDHLKRVHHSISRFVGFLEQKGLFVSRAPVPVYEPLMEGYLAWMRDYQHAGEATLELRRRSLKGFLEGLGAEATAEGLSALTAERVETFFIEYAHRIGRPARRSMQAALRTFLRFCFREGYVVGGLDRAVPTLRTYKLARVPRGLSEAQAQSVLESVDRSTPAGRRDYAVLQLLHTYGVRSGQVRALQLSDVRWSEEKILFKAVKNGKESLLPLTTGVGESLLDYLQNARPRCSVREVFVTCRAPYHRLPESSSLSEIVRRRIRAAGIDVPAKGAHAFRHGFATRMVADGHPLKAVADVLGHRHLSTTFLYTKVDFNALGQVALEWPGEVGS